LLYSWARQVGLSEADTADLVQDVFVTLLQTLPTFEYDRRKSFRRWLRTVTINKWREQGRRRARSPVQAGRGFGEDQLPAADLEQFWDVEFRQQLVSRALSIMNRDFQPATWKAFWEQVVGGRPAAAVAAELGMTVGAAFAAKFRILDRLRQEMAGMLD
jgi:RNA polymerase sigma-70 factor (ECF subfamily)